ncbi:MAG: enoyl-ACP reductase FabI [Solirubrobacteraceae bacterium]
MLAGKRLLLSGVLSRESIAFAVAQQAQEAGAEVILTSFGRAMPLTERAAGRLPRDAQVLELDANEPAHYVALRNTLQERVGAIDGALHAIAFAPQDALGGRFMSTCADSAVEAFRTSAYSYKALAEAIRPLLSPGASIVGLDFDAQVAWPAYDWMGVAKAALEAVNRYLARDLGRHGIRTNLVSAGPLGTLAARGIPGFSDLVDLWSAQAPLGWDAQDPVPVARAVCWLLSDWSRGISGEIVHVDGGFHAMGAPIEPRSEGAPR